MPGKKSRYLHHGLLITVPLCVKGVVMVGIADFGVVAVSYLVFDSVPLFVFDK